MDKKIGKNIFFLAAFLVFQTSVRAEPTLSLRVTDQDENPLQAAGLEIPFLIHVEVLNNKREDLAKPLFSLPSAFEIIQQGTKNSMRSINGQTFIKESYVYAVIPHQEGTYKLGPAVIQVSGGKEIRSNAITVHVAPEQKGIGTTKNDKAFLELFVSEKEPYVGQAITAHIRFYAAQEGIHLDHIQEPVFPKCQITPLVGPKAGTTVIKGIHYHYLDWQFSLYPLESGKIVLPSLAGQMTLPVSRRSGGDIFSLMSSMFGGATLEKVYSNAVTLQVKTIPPHEPPVTAVGNFTSFNAKLGSEKAAAGEGVTLTLELIGQGNTMHIMHPPLMLPEGLKYYDSHAKEHVLSDTIIKKDFEYIVQGLKPGLYVIPGQEITYFDTKNHTFKTLQTKPLKIIISGELKTKNNLDQERKKETMQDAESLPALETHFKKSSSSAGMSWKFFWLICVVMSLFVIAFFVKKMWTGYQDIYAVDRNFKKAFDHARGKIKDIKKTKHSSELYHLFMDLFAKRLKIPRAELSEAVIEKHLRSVGFSEDKIKEWRHFFSHLMAITFSALPHTDDLYNEVSLWIDTMELFI